MARHEKVLAAIFADPINGGIHWSDVESLLIHLGATREERAGSRVLFTLRGQKVIFHRPHPRRECGVGLVRAVRRFLEQAGVRP